MAGPMFLFSRSASSTEKKTFVAKAKACRLQFTSLILLPQEFSPSFSLYFLPRKLLLLPAWAWDRNEGGRDPVRVVGAMQTAIRAHSHGGLGLHGCSQVCVLLCAVDYAEGKVIAGPNPPRRKMKARKRDTLKRTGTHLLCYSTGNQRHRLFLGGKIYIIFHKVPLGVVSFTSFTHRS